MLAAPRAGCIKRRSYEKSNLKHRSSIALTHWINLNELCPTRRDWIGGMTIMDATLTSRDCDVLVIGSGAGGLSTAITAKAAGLDVLVIEKEEFFGGTTAFSGGVLWIPGNPQAVAAGIE